MFEKLKKYIKNINIVDSIYYVILNIPGTWVVDIKDDGVSYQEYDNNKVIFGNSPDVPMDFILESLDIVVLYNLEMEAKTSLLEVKKRELEELFRTTSLESLLKLEFNLKTEIPKEEVIDEVGDNEN